MKSIIDSYIGLWVIMLFVTLCIAFTSINMNVVQARKMYNDIKSQVQASNGEILKYNPATGAPKTSSDDPSTTTVWSKGTFPVGDARRRTIEDNGYQYKYRISRVEMHSDQYADNETWIYNDLYKIEFVYYYGVPLFGLQVYPITGYTY